MMRGQSGFTHHLHVIVTGSREDTTAEIRTAIEIEMLSLIMGIN